LAGWFRQSEAGAGGSDGAELYRAVRSPVDEFAYLLRRGQQPGVPQTGFRV
jgi:hypothetical protein